MALENYHSVQWLNVVVIGPNVLKNKIVKGRLTEEGVLNYEGFVFLWNNFPVDVVCDFNLPNELFADKYIFGKLNDLIKNPLVRMVKSDLDESSDIIKEFLKKEWGRCNYINYERRDDGSLYQLFSSNEKKTGSNPYYNETEALFKKMYWINKTFSTLDFKDSAVQFGESFNNFISLAGKVQKLSSYEIAQELRYQSEKIRGRSNSFPYFVASDSLKKALEISQRILDEDKILKLTDGLDGFYNFLKSAQS